MNVRRLPSGLCLSLFCLAAASPAFGLANRVFVSARSGNNANSCDNILTPCQTFAGAVLQLNPGGEAIVLDSGGYGPVTITQSMTIEAPPGVLAFIHPPSGIAVTVNAPGATVTLRGLVLNAGASDGIYVQAVGTLNVENCFITGFVSAGIHMDVAGQLNVKNTDVTACSAGVFISNASMMTSAGVSIDHCHLDANIDGFAAQTFNQGSRTTATNSTANDNTHDGWLCGSGTSGQDRLYLEFCSGSGNGNDGLSENSANGASQVVVSNCVFVENAGFEMNNAGAGGMNSRGNNTVVGATNGTIGPIFPK